MTSVVIPLDTNADDGPDDGWGQYIKIDIHEEPVSNLEYLTTSLVDLEEGKLKKKDNKICNALLLIPLVCPNSYYCTQTSHHNTSH